MAEADTLPPPTEAKTEKAPPPARAPAPVDQERLMGALGLSGNRETLAQDRARIDALGERALAPPMLRAPPPQSAPTDPLQAFGQPAMWLAAFGGLFTRRPFVNTIKAAAGVMQATHEQDQALAKSSYDTWKVESENALKLAKYEQDAYKAAVSKYAADARAGQAEVLTTATAFKNAALTQIYQTEGMEGVIKYVKMGGHSLASAEEAKQKFDIIHQEQIALKSITEQRVADRAKELGRSLTPAESAQITLDARAENEAKKAGLRSTATAKGRESALADPLTPQAADMEAAVFLASGQLPSRLGQHGLAQMLNRAGEILKDSGHTVEDVIAGRFTLKADGHALQAVTRQAEFAGAYERAARKEFGLVESLIPKTPEPLDSQLLTRWVRTGEKQFGDVKTAQYMAALISGLDEYAKILSGATGAGGSTDASRAQAAALIPEGATTDQVKGVIQVLNQGMDFKIQGYREQLDGIKRRLATPVTSAGVPGHVAVPAAGPAGGGRTPPPQAVEMLKGDPSKAAQFDAIFGPGAAQRVLGQ